MTAPQQMDPARRIADPDPTRPDATGRIGASRPIPGAQDGRVARGEDSRARLRTEALKLFAEKGYSQTSTREICAAAGVNVAAIHYHFHDKAGLYRDVYLVPVREMMQAAIALTTTGAPGASVLRDTYQAFLAPLKVADLQTMQILRLHFREQTDPTGLVGDEVLRSSRMHFDGMVALLTRALGLAAPDDDVRRLACSLVAIAADFLTRADWIRRIVPSLYGGADEIDRMVERMTAYGLAMVAAERRFREVR